MVQERSGPEERAEHGALAGILSEVAAIRRDQLKALNLLEGLAANQGMPQRVSTQEDALFHDASTVPDASLRLGDPCEGEQSMCSEVIRTTTNVITMAALP